MALASVYALISKFGALRTFERLPTPGPATTVSVKSMMRRADEVPMVGDVSQYNVQIYVRHSDLVSAGFPVPMLKGDRVTEISGTVHTVHAVEEMHDGSGEVGGYRLWARGH